MKQEPLIKKFTTEDELIKYFGRSNPSIPEKNEFYNKCWKEWESNSLVLSTINDSSDIYRYLRFKAKLSRFDFLQRGKEIRFRNKEDLFLAKIKYKQKSSF